MDYLANFDKLVLNKCKELKQAENFALNNIALGRVERSMDGGYISRKSSSLDKHKKHISNLFEQHGYYINLKEAHTEKEVKEEVDNWIAELFEATGGTPEWLNELSE